MAARKRRSPAGYSGRPLIAKLGVKEGARACVVDGPPHYYELLGPLPERARFTTRLRGEKDFVHIFVDRAATLARRLPRIVRVLSPTGMVWISWPKQASGVETDLTGNEVRRLGLEAGLVDVKVCAVDDTWSGLKFVIPLERRPG